METPYDIVEKSNGNIERHDKANAGLYWQIVLATSNIAYKIGLDNRCDINNSRSGFSCVLSDTETSSFYSLVVSDIYGIEIGVGRDVKINFDNGDYLKVRLRYRKDTEIGGYNLELSSFEYQFNDLFYSFFIGKPEYCSVETLKDKFRSTLEEAPVLDIKVLERLEFIKGIIIRDFDVIIADIPESKLIRKSLGDNTIIDTEKRIVVTYKMVGTYPNGQRLETPGNFELKDYDKAIRDGRESLLANLRNNLDTIPVLLKGLK